MTTTVHPIPISRDVLIEKSIVVIECAGCSIDFGIGRHFQAKRRSDHQTFYCPSGHSNYYPGPSAAEKRTAKLEAELEAARSLAAREARRRESAERAATNALAAARRQDYRARAAKAALTRARRREAAGMCPVESCRRTFANLADHMAGEHPPAAT